DCNRRVRRRSHYLLLLRRSPRRLLRPQPPDRHGRRIPLAHRATATCAKLVAARAHAALHSPWFWPVATLAAHAVPRLRQFDRRRPVPPITRRHLRPLLARDVARQQPLARRHRRLRLLPIRGWRRRW